MSIKSLVSKDFAVRLLRGVCLALAVTCFVSAQTYKISTMAGGGLPVNIQGRFSGDGGAATGAALSFPGGVAVDNAGNLYIAEWGFSGNSHVRKVVGGAITTIVGDGSHGSNGDGGPAISAQLSQPKAVAVDSLGDVYIAEGGRIRKVSGGVISTVAGGGTFGDNGAATSAALYRVSSLGVDSAGKVYFADPTNSGVRLLEPQP